MSAGAGRFYPEGLVYGWSYARTNAGQPLQEDDVGQAAGRGWHLDQGHARAAKAEQGRE